MGKEKIPHNCESVCANSGNFGTNIIRAPKTVEGAFEKGERISVCQLCRNQNHFVEVKKGSK